MELPGADGYSIGKHISQHPHLKGVPIILTSDKEGAIDMEYARSCGIDAFIPKPIKPDALLEIINGFVFGNRHRAKKMSSLEGWKVFLVHSDERRGKHLLDMLDFKLRKSLLERHHKYEIIIDRGNIVQEGKEALTEIKRIHPHILIISDVFVGLNGWQVCEALRKDENLKNIRIIMLVSRKSKDIDWLKELGRIDEILYEPFHSKDLVDCVRKIMRDKIDTKVDTPFKKNFSEHIHPPD